MQGFDFGENVSLYFLTTVQVLGIPQLKSGKQKTPQCSASLAIALWSGCHQRCPQHYTGDLLCKHGHLHRLQVYRNFPPTRMSCPSPCSLPFPYQSLTKMNLLTFSLSLSPDRTCVPQEPSSCLPALSLRRQRPAPGGSLGHI